MAKKHSTTKRAPRGELQKRLDALTPGVSAVQRLRIIAETHAAVWPYCMDNLAQTDEKRKFAEAVGIPYLAAFLLEEFDMLRLEDIDEFNEWMKRERIPRAIFADEEDDDAQAGREG